jgi:hypothetical protein
MTNIGDHPNQRVDPYWLFDVLMTAHPRQTGRPEIAVLSAQMAVEACAERVFEELFLYRGLGLLAEVLVDCLPDRSFMDPRSRRLWYSLTGTRIKDAQDWKRYNDHVVRRNRVAHRGTPITDDAATESWDACRGLIQFMLDTVATVTGYDSRRRDRIE